MQVQTQSSSQYIKARIRDAIALSKDIADSKGELGYATLVNNCDVLIKGDLIKFKAPEDARAFILRRFW